MSINAPVSTGCNCQHCQNSGSSKINSVEVWETNDVPPAIDVNDDPKAVSEVVPAPKPPPEAPDASGAQDSHTELTPMPDDSPAPKPSPMPEAVPMPAADPDRPIEPISYVDPIGNQKASTVVTAAATLGFSDDEKPEPLIPTVEQTVIPAEAVIHKRIQ